MNTDFMIVHVEFKGKGKRGKKEVYTYYINLANIIAATQLADGSAVLWLKSEVEKSQVMFVTESFKEVISCLEVVND